MPVTSRAGCVRHDQNRISTSARLFVCNCDFGLIPRVEGLTKERLTALAPDLHFHYMGIVLFVFVFSIGVRVTETILVVLTAMDLERAALNDDYIVAGAGVCHCFFSLVEELKRSGYVVLTRLNRHWLMHDRK